MKKLPLELAVSYVMFFIAGAILTYAAGMLALIGVFMLIWANNIAISYSQEVKNRNLVNGVEAILRTTGDK